MWCIYYLNNYNIDNVDDVDEDIEVTTSIDTAMIYKL